MTEQAVVYRIFDASGVLLYIGRTVSGRMRARWKAHRKTQPWWPEVKRIDLAFYDSWREAFLEERRAILAEHPRHNKERFQVVAPAPYRVPAWNPLPPDLKKRIAAAGRKRAQVPRRAPGRDDALAACFYEALSLGCQPSPVARVAGLSAEDVRRLSAKHLVRHPELPPIPVRQSLAARSVTSQAA